MHRPIITLTTDFGLRDPYVAEMKAVILSICPDATIVDVSHEIEKFNVGMGAYVLASAVPYFPKDTIHVAVVDPSVGTKRRAVLVKLKQGYLVGPDNGILALAAEDRNVQSIYEITNPKLMRPEISDTFHGRDVFAPTAAHLAIGTPEAEFGPQTREIVTPGFAKIVRSGNAVIGEVVHVDGFGNIITNLGEKELKFMNAEDMVNVDIANVKIKLKFCKAYAEVKKHELLAITGSHGFLEISLNQGSAAERLEAKAGDKVTLRRS
jgi:S-adenosylmethionine hydrolase